MILIRVFCFAWFQILVDDINKYRQMEMPSFVCRGKLFSHLGCLSSKICSVRRGGTSM